MFHLESFIAGPYNVVVSAAVIIGLVLTIRAGNRADIAPDAWRVLLIAGVTAGLIGSTLIFLDFHAPRPGEKSNLGGLIAGIATVVILARWLRIGSLRALDLMAVPTLVAMAIGRIGCFLAGCCAGTPTTLPWGIHVDDEAHAIHPVQLYEVTADLALVGALTRWVPMQRPGQRFAMAVAGYAGIRFTTEFVRAGRTNVAGLNPVQWSVLIVGLAMIAWLLCMRRRHEKRGAQVATVATHASSREYRTVAAALGTVTVLLVLTLGRPQTFEPYEATFLFTAACALGAYVLWRWTRQSPARRYLTPTCALFLLQSPVDPPERKREILLGARHWSGRYMMRVGEYPLMFTDCDGNSVGYVRANRRTATNWFTAGFRDRTAAGTRITVEGQVLMGRDKVSPFFMQEGARLYEPVGTTSIRAAGATATFEARDHHLSISMIGGDLSRDGNPWKAITGSITGRAGVADGWFAEGHFTPREGYSTTGEISYAGVGYVLSDAGARLLLGIGAGGQLSLHLPVRGFEIDVTGRAPANAGNREGTDGTLSIGLKRAFTIR